MKRSQRFPLPALLALAILALAAGVVGLRLSTPADGTRLDLERAIWWPDGVAIATLPGDPGGLHSGDVVLALDGRSVPALVDALVRPAGPGRDPGSARTVRYTVRRDGQTREVVVSLGRYPLADVLAGNWGPLGIMLAIQLVAALVFWRRPRDPAAQLFFLSWSWIAASQAVWLAGVQPADLLAPAPFWLFWLFMAGVYTVGPAVFLHLLLVWPQPHPAVVRRPWLIGLAYVAPAALGAGVLLVSRIVTPDTLAWLGLWQTIGGSIELLIGCLILLAMLTNYRNLPAGSVGRLQLRWIMFGTGLAFAVGLVLGALPELLGSGPLVDRNLLALVGLPLPLGVAVAVLKYRLFDIDLIINRALVYGTLTAIVGGLYLAAVGLSSRLFNGTESLPAVLLAAVLVAVLLQPLRERLQRQVNRWMYGERDDPYAVVTRLTQRLGATSATDEVLPLVVETLAQALKLPYTAILLEESGKLRPGASYGSPGRALIRLPLVYQAERLGELRVSPRAPGEALSAADHRLLGDLAQQAGAVLQMVRLTGELQRSREHLVTAREEERRRLRRDLHDGLGPLLASVTLKLHAARALLQPDHAAEPLLVDVEAQTQAAVADIRRLVYALRPPALDELGLVPALREQAAQVGLTGLSVAIDAPEILPPLSAAVEVATYRIALEALTNVVRHAQARHCSIRLALPAGGLTLEIADDGVGPPAQGRSGVGWTSMRERAAELGGSCVIAQGPAGGTRVLVYLPLPHGDIADPRLDGKGASGPREASGRLDRAGATPAP